MMRYFGGVIGAGLLGLILSSGGEALNTEVFRILFAVLLVTAVLTALTSASIDKFASAEEPGTV
jgi:ABC-type phosphate/phosphonate transport system permease subunit